MVIAESLMHIYCDESGSFATANYAGAWCIIASYVLAESQRKAASDVLRRHKLRAGATYRDEVKRASISEADYFIFLAELARVGGVAIAIATDSGANQGAAANQIAQLSKLTGALEGASNRERDEIDRVLRDMSSLSPQLYVEFACRLHLGWRTIRLATLYFSGRYPATLGRFNWQLDEKPPNLQRLYRSSLPGFIQELAKDQPLELLEEANYQHLRAFLIPSDVHSGIQDADIPPANQRIYNAARMLTEEAKFVDSKTSFGVQIADLIVGGLRACLRGEFKNNDRAARLLGRLLFDKDTEHQILPLMHFTEGPKSVLDEGTALAAIRAMGQSAMRLRAR
jgi:hypothetical protein